MTADHWKIVFWVLGSIVISLFIVQGAFWFALRRRRISLRLWRKLATAWLVTGLALMLVGGALLLLGPPLLAYQATLVSLIGGTWNAVVAATHLWIVASLTRRR